MERTAGRHSPAVEDYAKAIYTLQERADRPVTTTALAIFVKEDQRKDRSKTHVKLVARDLGGFDLPFWREEALTLNTEPSRG